jgi:hypothetical protein
VTNLVTIVPRAFTLPCRFETPVPAPIHYLLLSALSVGLLARCHARLCQSAKPQASAPLGVVLCPNDHHLRQTSFPSYPNSEMIDDDEINPYLTSGGRSPFDMDEAFCARMRAAIEAGLENAPIGVVTTPGTKNPKYVLSERLPLASPQRAVEHA